MTIVNASQLSERERERDRHKRDVIEYSGQSIEVVGGEPLKLLVLVKVTRLHWN
jgi:hypothetical protein